MKIKEIQEALDYYKIFSPKNYSEEKEKFRMAFEKGEPFNPVFVCGDEKQHIDKVQRAKDAMPRLKSRSKNKLTRSFLDLYAEIADLVSALLDEDYTKVTKISGQLFGDVSTVDLKELKGLFRDVSYDESLSDLKFTSKELAVELTNSLKTYGLEGWVFEFSEANQSEVSIYDLEKKIVIKPSCKFSQIDKDRIICHEIVAHALQAINAKSDPNSAFLTHYLGTELQYEGLAIFTELNMLSEEHTESLLKRYVQFLIADKVAIEGNFNDVFAAIFNLSQDFEFAYMCAYRSKRGFKDTSKKGCFQKENSYLFGCLEVIKLVEGDFANYNKLLHGCFPFDAIECINESTNVYVPIKNLERSKMSSFKTRLKSLNSSIVLE